jgi:hypothetical protein
MKTLLRYAGIGSLTGLAGTVTYAIIFTMIELPLAIIAWAPSPIDIAMGLQSHFFDFSFFLFIPFTIICALIK